MAAPTQAEATELFRRQPDGFIDVGAGSVAYRTIGQGPDVLFVHGWPASGATFRRLLPHLANHVTCHVIDFPSAGDSKWQPNDPISVQGHIDSLPKVVTGLGLDTLAVVAHDSGGLIARHALAGDERVTAMGLINTEPTSVGARFRMFLAIRHIPGAAAIFGFAAGKPAIINNKFVFGDAFTDRSHLSGEFAEFFIHPLRDSKVYRDMAVKVLKSFDLGHVDALAALHARITCPVQLVWGEDDKFFLVDQAREMVGTFPNAELAVIPNAGLFSHEEKPAEIAAALLPVLTGQR